ncbi:MFS transporter [Tsukamurella sp. PLM1]|uniref:MFS transporter n=1 Tax=Tsukamurella sp. PLM1 TaxID=2929795 RepID=UPI00204A8E43|nr:hypothetical protein MTP03_45870 [Tsukamurella sp. PLM1]
MILRILQGIGAGAEGSTAAVLAYEHADGATRGRQAAWPALGSSIGLLAASLTVTAVTSLDDADLYSWGWRIPFVLSFALVGLGLLVRRGLPESPEFASGARPDEGTARTLVRTHWRGLVAVMVMTVGYLGASYTFKTFSISYLKEFRDVPANVGTFGVALASAVALVVIPVSGWLTDRVGARRLMLIGAAGIALIAFPFFVLLDTGRPAYIWFALIVASGVLIPLILASSSSFMAAQFPASVRSTGAGAGREIAAAAAGGVVPLIALSLVTASESHSTVGVSVLFIASGACIAIACALDQTDRVARDERSVADRPAGQPRGDDRAGNVVPQREHR